MNRSTSAMQGHPIPLTAFVLIVLYKVESNVYDVSLIFYIGVLLITPIMHMRKENIYQ